MHRHSLHMFLINIFTLICLSCWETLVDCCTKVTVVNTVIKIGKEDDIEPSLVTTITGCISPEMIGEQLGQVIVGEIECYNQTIPTFYEKAVANLPEVWVVTFSFSKIKQIKKNAFFNLPKLGYITLDNNNIDTIERDAFANVNLKSLVLTKNKLLFLENGVFSNHPNLYTIYLDSNELDAFKPAWCSGSLKLEEIQIGHNFIRTIDRDTFKPFKFLQHINLSFNQIKYIHKDAFDGLTALKNLELQGNRISKLEPNLFKPLTNLSLLWLNDNNLTYITDETLEDLAATPDFVMSIHTNPWQCACYEKIVKWITETSVYVVNASETCGSPDNPVCVIPLLHANLCLEVREEDLDAVFYKSYYFNPYCDQTEEETW